MSYLINQDLLVMLQDINYLLCSTYHQHYLTAIKRAVIVPLFVLTVLQRHLKHITGGPWSKKLDISP